MLLPVLLAHAPRIRMREVSAALLRTRFAPSLLHVSAMNDPLSLERFVGIQDDPRYACWPCPVHVLDLARVTLCIL